MIVLVCDNHRFDYELEQLTRMFFPGIDIRAVFELPSPRPEQMILTSVRKEGGVQQLSAEAFLPGYTGSFRAQVKDPGEKNEAERALSVCLFRLLEQATGVTLPWGILTGVRPVRLGRQWMESGLDEAGVRKRFLEEYFAQPQKVDLTLRTGAVQQPILDQNTPGSYSLYVSIPFCPTRCLYCSFVSHAIDKAAKLIPDYLRLLRRELEDTARRAAGLGLKLQTIYIGGGTPTSLDTAQLEQVLQGIADCFDLDGLLEYTVEAGRPDTITQEKLALLQKFGVDRISINPQTMDDTILQSIGRSHTARQVEDSFRLARDMGFKAINMDLIAGLPGETRQSFTNTLDRVLALVPENITLHTLTVKRSSTLRTLQDAFAGSAIPLNSLLEQAQGRFAEAGYGPYYLYRQKGTVQNLENTGFSLPGYEGIYNVYSMEEVHSILAVGAGAVSKLCCGSDIKRITNFKYPYEYIGRFQELIERKNCVEEFYEKHFGNEIHTC